MNIMLCRIYTCKMYCKKLSASVEPQLWRNTSLKLVVDNPSNPGLSSWQHGIVLVLWQLKGSLLVKATNVMGSLRQSEPGSEKTLDYGVGCVSSLWCLWLLNWSVPGLGLTLVKTRGTEAAENPISHFSMMCPNKLGTSYDWLVCDFHQDTHK